jgi:hypothetical protein
VRGDGQKKHLSAAVSLDCRESCWAAARVQARKEENEPELQAHTNAAYLVRNGRPVMMRAARQSVVNQWEAEIARYREANLVFTAAQKKEFFDQAERALAALRRPLQP